MNHPIVLICLLYLIAMGLFSLYLKNLVYTFLRVGRWILGVGLALHLGFVASWFVKGGNFVPANGFERSLVILAVVALLTWILSVRKTSLFIVVFALPSISLALGIAAFFGSTEPSVVNLHNPWLWTHIVLSVLGDSFLLFASLISFAYLLVEFQLRRKAISPLFTRLPSLVDFDLALGEFLLAGFVLLTLGLGIGIGFAEKYWTDRWYLDPKILFSALVWFLYAVLLALRKSSQVYRGRRSALMALFGFLAILIVSWNLSSGHHDQATSPSQEIDGR